MRPPEKAHPEDLKDILGFWFAFSIGTFIRQPEPVSPKTAVSYPPDRNEQEGGMSFPKRGKFFPRCPGRSGTGGTGGGLSGEVNFAREIASALERVLREGDVRIKTVAGWTGRTNAR